MKVSRYWGDWRSSLTHSPAQAGSRRAWESPSICIFEPERASPRPAAAGAPTCARSGSGLGALKCQRLGEGPGAGMGQGYRGQAQTPAERKGWVRPLHAR